MISQNICLFCTRALQKRPIVDVFAVYNDYLACTLNSSQILNVHCKKIHSVYTVPRNVHCKTVYIEKIFLQCTMIISSVHWVVATYSTYTVKTSTQCTLCHAMYSMYTVLLNLAHCACESCTLWFWILYTVLQCTLGRELRASRLSHDAWHTLTTHTPDTHAWHTLMTHTHDTHLWHTLPTHTHDTHAWHTLMKRVLLWGG